MRNVWPVFVICLLLLFQQLSWAQPTDSLKNALKSSQGEERLEVLEQLAYWELRAEEMQRWADQLFQEAKAQDNTYFQAMALHYRANAKSIEGELKASNNLRLEAIELFSAIDREDKVARQYINMGNSYSNLSQFDSAQWSYEKAIDYAIKSKDSFALNGAYINISTIYHELGDYKRELETLLAAKDLASRLKERSQDALITYNIGVFYHRNKEFDKAKEQVKEAQAMYIAMGDSGKIANTHNFFASLYFEENKIDSALAQLKESMRIYKSLGDRSNVAFIKMNIGQTLGKVERYTESLKELREAKEIFESIGQDRFIAQCHSAISKISFARGDYEGALYSMKKAVAMAEKVSLHHELLDWYQALAEIEYTIGQPAEAYNHMVQHLSLSDSMQEVNSQEIIREMEAQYQNERKQLEIANLKNEKALQQAELEGEQAKRYALVGGLFLALLLCGVTVFALMAKRRDNRVIKAQKQEVELQRDQIDLQRSLVEEKNKEITDSIVYAKRIQQAILPPSSLIAEQIPDSFILYLPKDVVAGDFYWLEPVDDWVYFAAADCTGHGVPGAMVSVVCVNSLNRSVREFELREPGDILDKTRELVIKEFEKSEEEVKDGMDISLCAFNPKTKKLKWAGAQNALWIVTTEAPNLVRSEQAFQNIDKFKLKDLTLYELKPDKQPIGVYIEPKPFTTHHLQLNSGSMIYLTSDGFPDQFGGSNGKKFKTTRMKENLLQLASLPIKEQKEQLLKQFNDWKGELDQVDDVCVIGVKVG